MPPKISIILPALNAASTLTACLGSVIRQSLAEWECLLLDDGSSDSTPAIANRFAAADRRFRVLSAPHRGLVSVLNDGIERCRGDYIARMDADDLMHRRRLEQQCALLDAEPGLAAAGCHVRMFPRVNLLEGTRSYESWLNGIDSPRRIREDAFVECPVAHPTLMIRRPVLNEFRYRERGWPEDYDLVLRLLESDKAIGILPRRRLCWRHGPDRLSRTDNRYSIESFTACKAAFLAGGFLSDTEHYILWGHGGTGRALRKALAQHGKHPTHIIELHPGRLGNKIANAHVIPPEQLPSIPLLPIIVSVAGTQPRQQIRTALTQMGFTELTHYICTA